MGDWTIGKVARQAGVHIETLRYYERKGLLPKPLRTAANYRIYSDETVQRVLFVKRAQRLGFTLREIKTLIALGENESATCARIHDLVEEKMREFEQRIEAFRALKKTLSKILSKCAGRAPIPECPLLEAIDPEEASLAPPAGFRTAHAPEASATGRAPSRSASRQRILYVDDDSDLLAGIAELFRGKPASLLTAGSGTEALDLMDRRSFDTIVSDLHMDGMTGLEFLAQARKKNAKAYRILIGDSGSSLFLSRLPAGPLPFDLFVSKPVDRRGWERVFDMLTGHPVPANPGESS